MKNVCMVEGGPIIELSDQTPTLQSPKPRLTIPQIVAKSLVMYCILAEMENDEIFYFALMSDTNE